MDKINKFSTRSQDELMQRVLQETSRAGFFRTRLRALTSWAQGESLWAKTLNLGCCGAEIVQAKGARYDLEQFGMKFAPSAPQADVLIVGGAISHKMAPVLQKIYEEMSEPRFVIALGACASGGGAYHESYAIVKSCDAVIPVDIYIAGCPPTAEALVYGILQLQRKIQKTSYVKEPAHA
jgi:NADH-quinone oxidoreductase subunit B